MLQQVPLHETQSLMLSSLLESPHLAAGRIDIAMVSREELAAYDDIPQLLAAAKDCSEISHLFISHPSGRQTRLRILTARENNEYGVPMYELYLLRESV